MQRCRRFWFEFELSIEPILDKYKHGVLTGQRKLVVHTYTDIFD